jgi:hypothetical protein
MTYYILIARNIIDDTMIVLCHWHHESIDKMWETYDDRNLSERLLAKV